MQRGWTVPVVQGYPLGQTAAIFRSAWVHLQKKTTAGALLSVDISSQGEEAGRVMGPPPEYPATLPTSWMQCCSNCKGPQVSGEALDEIGEESSICEATGSYRPCWVQPFDRDCFRITRAPTIFLCKEA